MSRIPAVGKWHGGKWYLASDIVAMMPKHTHYVEPYFGMGAVLFAKNPNSVSEVVNDLNGDLTNFWQILQDTGSFGEFSRIVSAVPFSEAEYNRAESTSSTGSDVNRAVGFFIRCRQSLAGRMESFATLSRTRTRRGMNEQASAWLTAIEGLPLVHERLKRVAILNRDALDVIRQQDGSGALFYLDPPYIHESRATTGQYAFEMTDEQHIALCATIRKCVGKVIISGYPSELYRIHLETHGWKRHDFSIANHASGAAAKRRMTESLWLNY